MTEEDLWELLKEIDDKLDVYYLELPIIEKERQRICKEINKLRRMNDGKR